MRFLMRIRWVLAALVGGAALGACEPGESGMLSCGDLVCGPRQECRRSTEKEPTCVCQPGYIGESCQVCASGYRRTADQLCVLIAIDCDDNPEICGTHGQCTSARTPTAGDDSCSCDRHYTGRLCELCADGYQDNDRNETCEPTCAAAALRCDGARECDDESGFPVCSCPVGTTGDDCEFCALGYRYNGSRCVPTCAAQGLSCDANQYCSDEGDVAECRCLPGYTGPLCGECASGYDDTLREGECLPTCEVAELSCGEHSACADDVGFAYCQCDTGWAGVTCDECATGHQGAQCANCSDGYLRLGDEVCQPDCAVSGCDERQHCSPRAGVLACVCDLGYAGDDCTDCAVGFAADGNGHCTAAVSSSFTVVAVAEVDSARALVAIDPETGSVDPLRSLDPAGLAFDPASRTLFMAAGGEVGPIDLTSAELSSLATLTADAGGGPLVFDLDTGMLFAVDEEGQLVRIDPDDGETTVLGPTGLTVADLAYDSANTRLLAATSGDSPGLFELDPTDGSPTRIGDLPPHTTGLTYTADGTLIGLRPQPLSTAQARVEVCRGAVANLDIAGYSRAAGTALQPAADTLTVTLENQRSAGVELVALGLAGATSGRVVTVAGDNPDAIFCIATDDEATAVTVAGSARFRALIYYSRSGELDLAVAPGFPAPESATIVVGPGSSIVTADHPAVREYTAREWADRRLPTGDPIDLLGAGAIVELDPSDGAVLSTTELDAAVVPVGPLSPWTP